MPASKNQRRKKADERIATLSSNMAASVAADYLDPVTAAGTKLVSIQDEEGWNVCSADLSGNAKTLMPVVLLMPAFVPSLSFLALVILNVDSILNNLVVHKQCKIEAYKYAGKLRSCVQHLRYLRRCSPRSRDPAIQTLKNLVVFAETDPWRRRSSGSTWDAALKPLPWHQLPEPVLVVDDGKSLPAMASSAEKSLPAMASNPSFEDLAKLDFNTLKEMVRSKFSLQPDDVCVIVSVTASNDTCTVIEDSDDEKFDVTPWCERGYEQDDYMLEGEENHDQVSVLDILAKLAAKSGAEVAQELQAGTPTPAPPLPGSPPLPVSDPSAEEFLGIPRDC